MSLTRYNAERCEAAASSKCVCHCGGAFHGKKHSEQWIRERELERGEAMPDLFIDGKLAPDPTECSADGAFSR